MKTEDSQKKFPSPEALTIVEKDMKEFMTPLQVKEATPGNYTRHIVKQGECISVISRKYGHFWETIWYDSVNQKLKDKRKNPDCLMTDDVVFVVDLREKSESVATESKHRFRHKGVPFKLTMVIMGASEPRADEPYRIEFDTGEVMEGNLDEDGLIDIVLPEQAYNGVLQVGNEPDIEFIDFDLGALDPIDSISGIQSRLFNLGFFSGEITGCMSLDTREAIADFQDEVGLDITGKADRKTRDMLEKEHDQN